MKEHRVRAAILFFVLVAIVVLGFKVTDLQKQLDSIESDRAQVDTLMAGDGNVAGFTCGVLTMQRANEFLDSSKDLKQAYVQGPSEIVRDGQPAQDKLFWTDSCRYENADDNSSYVELYITTFQSSDVARTAFPDFLRVVNEVDILPAEGYGDELLYEGGTYYLLRGNQAIQVAASNGIPSEIDSFSRAVFDSILSNF